MGKGLNSANLKSCLQCRFCSFLWALQTSKYFCSLITMYMYVQLKAWTKSFTTCSRHTGLVWVLVYHKLLMKIYAFEKVVKGNLFIWINKRKWKQSKSSFSQVLALQKDFSFFKMMFIVDNTCCSWYSCQLWTPGNLMFSP